MSNGAEFWTKFWCPGCEDIHSVHNGLWQVSGEGKTLTIQPSILLYEHQAFIDDSLPWGTTLTDPSNIKTVPRCHSFVTDGKIQFLDDSTHALAGQTVDIPELPEWLKED